MENLSPRKYRLNEFIERKVAQTGLPKARILDDLCTLLGVSKVQLRRIRAYTIDSQSAINTDQIQLLASYFSCSVDDLINKQEHATETP